MVPLGDAIRRLISGTSGVGPAFFEALAPELSRVVGARFALVSGVAEDGRRCAETLVFADGGEVRPGFTYALDGTPCGEVVAKGHSLLVPSGLAARFAGGAEMGGVAIESYAGHPLEDDDGRCLGVLAVLHDQSLPDPAGADLLLHLFAPRVGAELRRRLSDRRAAESRRFESLLNDLASRFLRAPLDELRLEVDTGARLLLETTGLLRATLLELGPTGDLEVWCCCSREIPSGKCISEQSRLPPYMRAELRGGRPFRVRGPEELPAGAAEDRLFLAGFARSVYIVPFSSGDTVFGALLLGSEDPAAWDGETVRHVRLAAEIFGHALARHRREKALRESEERYRRLLDLAPGAILVHSDGIIRFANQATCRLRGVAHPADLVGHPVVDLVHPEDRHLATERMKRLARGREVTPVEERLLREDGTSIEAVVSSVRTTWEGRPAVQVVANDISALRRAEEALASSEARYRSLFEQAAVGIADFDLDGRFARANGRYAELVGRTPAELVGRPGASVVHPGDIEKVRGELAEVLGGRRSRLTFEWRCVRPDGSMAWIRSDVSVVRGPDGKPANLVAVIDDMSVSHAAAEVADAAVAEIRERVEEWSATVDALPLGLVVLDVTGRVLRANRLAAALAREARFHPDAETWSVADLAPVEPWEAITSLVDAADDSPAPVEVVNGMGRTWLVSLARLVRSGDRSTLAIVTFADVTETAALKERLERSERLALMGSLMSGVAHEVRNPLFAISANANALDLELGEREDVGEMLAALREGVSRLRHVLEDLLDFGRSAPAVPAQGRLDVALQRAFRACDELVRGGGIAIVSRVPEYVLVRMDERRLGRALESVIANALVWATSRVELEMEPAATTEEGNAVRLLVRDDGPGFEPEALPRAFEPFYSRRRGATGLGLTIAQRILDQYGGAIAVANQERGGGLVTLTIPVGEAATAAEPESRTSG